MPVYKNKFVELEEWRRLIAEDEAREAAPAEVDIVTADEPEKPKAGRRPKSEVAAEASFAIGAPAPDERTSSTGDAPDPDPDNDGIGDGQGPFSSDERDIQEAEQEHAKLENKAADIEPHEDAELEQEAIELAAQTAADGARDHTGVDGEAATIDLEGNPKDEATIEADAELIKDTKAEKKKGK